MDSSEADSSYALQIAGDSYDWYKTAAIRSRRAHRASAVAIQVVAASIPVCVVIAPKLPAIPAVLGAIIVLFSGLRSIFNWQEDYLRFSSAREAVEQERRRFNLFVAPYDEAASRYGLLAESISAIERDEMSNWLKTAVRARPEIRSPAVNDAVGPKVEDS